MKTNQVIACEYLAMVAERRTFIRHCRRAIREARAAGFTGLADSVHGIMRDAINDAWRYGQIVRIWSRPAAPADPTPIGTALAASEPFFCAHEGGFTHRELPVGSDPAVAAGLPGWRPDHGVWDPTRTERTNRAHDGMRRRKFMRVAAAAWTTVLAAPLAGLAGQGKRPVPGVCLPSELVAARSERQAALEIPLHIGFAFRYSPLSEREFFRAYLARQIRGLSVGVPAPLTPGEQDEALQFAVASLQVSSEKGSSREAAGKVEGMEGDGI